MTVLHAAAGARGGLLCSCSYGAPSRLPRRSSAGLRARLAVRAQQEPSEPAADSSADDESRLEALEASARARRGMKVQQPDVQRQRQQQQAASSGNLNLAEWKEGKLLPEGWEAMNPLEKASVLYVGKYGFLYWANKAALASIIGIAVLWVVFRFVGPAFQLYQLQNGLQSTPNLF